MRSNPAHFEIHTPKDLSEVLSLLNESPKSWELIAGGTDLMVLFEAGQLKAKRYLNLWGLSELKGIEITPQAITLGALTTYSQLRENPVIRHEFPNLCQAAKETGAVSIQNRGTLGGNIANASPAADSPPALLCYDAELELVSSSDTQHSPDKHQNGTVRWLPYSEFHLGYKKTALLPRELISRIRIPRSGNRFHYYRKVGTRKAQAISKICFSSVFQIENQVIQQPRIAVGSVAPIPLRCVRTESSLRGQKLSSALIKRAKEVLKQEISPIDDIRSTREYRLRVTENLLEDSIQKALDHVELD